MGRKSKSEETIRGRDDQGRDQFADSRTFATAATRAKRVLCPRFYPTLPAQKRPPSVFLHTEERSVVHILVKVRQG